MGLCCAAILLALTGNARAGADDYNRVVSFGDSLSDNGNLDAAVTFELAGLLGFLSGSGYFDGRFSNGPTFAELLAGNADFANGESSQASFYGLGFIFNPATVEGSVNLAAGGATTEGGELFDIFGQPVGIPSVERQIEDFTDNGGEFSTNDLVTVLAGANDIFNADLDAGAAASAADTQKRNLSALIEAKASTIVIANLPNLGATPSFSGLDDRFDANEDTAIAGLVATDTFNSQLATDVEELAANSPDVNLVEADLQGFLDIVIESPEAFGFTNVTQACSFSDGTICSNPDEFLFFDSVHPTAAAHAFLAQFIDTLLSTDDQAAMTGPLGEVTVSSRLEASDILFRRAVPILWSNEAGGLYAEVVGQRGSGSGSGGANNFDYDLAGLRVGFDARDGNFIFGVAAAYLEGDIASVNLNANTSTTQLDAYLLHQYASFFTGLEAGVSFADFDDVRRDTGLPTLIGESETESVSYTVAATLGTNIDVRGIRLTPAVRAGYLSATVDGFSETVPLLALNISQREIEAGFWTARLRASTYLDRALSSELFFEAGYEDLFSVEDGYSAELIDNTAQGVTATPETIEARGFFLKAGASFDIGEGAKIAGEYGVGFEEDDGEVHSGRISLTIPVGGSEESLK